MTPEKATAEHADHAEKAFLCGLRVLGGFLLFVVITAAAQPFHLRETLRWTAVASAAAVRPASSDARAKIDSLIKTSGADVAVAFRTLDGRDELLIQPDVDYHAASTMKVPVMIELFRQARAGTLTLDDQIPVLNEFHSIVDGSPFALDTGDDSDAAIYKRIGSRMSYRDLLEAMITVSSNFATNLIIEHLGPKNIQRTTAALGATGMHVVRGVEDNKAFAKGLNNTTTARALLNADGDDREGRRRRRGIE